MRVHILGRDGYPVTAIQAAINAVSGITYESGLPGGMLRASCRIPWHYGAVPPRLLGCNLQVRDGIDCVWWGRVYDVTETAAGRALYLDITAAGPWAFANQPTFTSSYVAGGTWTATDILKAAVYGHVEDAAMKLGGDTGPAYDLGALEWTDATVQDVVSEVLRIGDSSENWWSFVIDPPVFAPCGSAAYTHSSDCSTTSFWTGTTGTVTTNKDLYHRGGSCQKMVGAAGSYGRGYKNVAAAATYYASEWVYVPKNAPAETTTLLGFYSSGAGANLGLVRFDASYILEARNVVAGETYTATGNQTIGRGTWHHIAARYTADLAQGYFYVWLDDDQIISQDGMNTGANTITAINYGMAENGAAERTLYIDDVVCSTAALDMEDTTTDETLPEPKILSLSATTHDFMVSLASVSSSSFTRSLANTANQVRVAYGSAGAYTVLARDTDSVGRYGQIMQMPSLTRSAGGTPAGYLKARYLARWKEPAPLLQPITLTTAPTKRTGGIMPLSRIRAGQTFAIRERPDLGVMYVGGAVYTAAQPGQSETCQITPVEPVYDVARVIALRTKRALT